MRKLGNEVCGYVEMREKVFPVETVEKSFLLLGRMIRSTIPTFASKS